MYDDDGRVIAHGNNQITSEVLARVPGNQHKHHTHLGSVIVSFVSQVYIFGKRK